jgi:hypothetical protein
MDKDAYIKKYAKSNKSPAQFDTDITKYRIQQGEIQSEVSNHVINFVRVDCNALKESLNNHCLQCQSKLSSLLNSIGVRELDDIFELFKSSRENLTVPPITLDQLREKIQTCKDLKDQSNSTKVLTVTHLLTHSPNHLLTHSLKQRFDPVREIYQTLLKYDVVIKETETIQLNNLESAFSDFVSMLFDADKLLEKSKTSMKRDLDLQIDQYSISMAEVRTQSLSELPYSVDKKPYEALAMIESYRNKISKAKEREQVLETGNSLTHSLNSPTHSLTHSLT